MKTVERNIQIYDKRITNWIGKEAIELVGKKLSETATNFIAEESLRGKIPSPYNEDFVRGLLEGKECICGRELKAQSEEWKSVANLLKSASTNETAGRLVAARSRCKDFKDRRKRAIGTFAEIVQRKGDYKSQQIQLSSEITELRQRIDGNANEEISAWESARRKSEEIVSEQNQKIGVVKGSIESRRMQMVSLERELKKATEDSNKAQKLYLRKETADRSAEMIQALLNNFERNSRDSIEDQTNLFLLNTVRKDYLFRIDVDFRIDLLYKNGEIVPRSGGENQLMSLAFIASLISFSQSREKDDTEMLTPGTVAPLVLDSPFGQLDPAYREAIAKYVPKMAQQVVLLVTSSQGDSGVLRALEPYVGAEYLLISENRGPQGNKPDDLIVTHGREYKLSFYNCERDLTRIDRIQ